MVEVAIVQLPGPAIAAASDGATVWCVAAGRLLAFTASGRSLREVAAPAGLRSLGAAVNLLASALDPGLIAWLDASSGRELVRRPFTGEPQLFTGGDAVWALDRRSGRASQLAEGGTLTPPISLGSVDRIAVERSRIWWTSAHDTLLRGGSRLVDLGVDASNRGGMTVCAGSVWISAPGGLLRVGTWGCELGPLVPASERPVPFLVCAGGAIVGGPDQGRLFVLDPAADADVRHLEVGLSDDLNFLIATRSNVWALPVRRREAVVVTVRP